MKPQQQHLSRRLFPCGTVWFLAAALLAFTGGNSGAEENIYRTNPCRTLMTAHQPAPDVAYREGVDANGWAVAPADVTPPALTAEDFNEVTIPLGIPARELSNNSAFDFQQEEGRLSDSYARIGEVTVRQDGATTLNGKRIDPIGSDIYRAGSSDCEEE
jgi:hypothetical protein